MKKVVSLILALAMTAALWSPPAAAAGSFSDIADPNTAEYAEILRALGVVGGVGGGLFKPEGTFDRASFCKMALIMMERGGEAALQATRVIFSDVTAAHWALGYVNAAASAPSGGGAPLVRGTGAGLFEPDKPITYGEAVTILMRVLGYTDADVAVAGAWYAGYLLRAGSIGLTDGIARGGEDPLTRAEAARLFYNLLFVSPKGKTTLYLTETLKGSAVKNTVILSAGERTVRAMAGNYSITRAPLPEGITGIPVNLYLDRDGRVLTAAALPDVTNRNVRIQTAAGRYLITDTGERITISGNTPVLQPDEDETTYGAIYTDLPSGSFAILSYGQTGDLNFIYLFGAGHNTAAMAAKTVNDLSFSALVGFNTANLTVYKNGTPALLSDARLYDVGVYNADAAVLFLSDRRLTGVYENVSPSPSSPQTVTVMGATLPVLDCAVEDLARFRLGDAVTLLLTDDNKVAGAMAPDVVRGTAVGVITLEGSSASVELTWGITLKGAITLSDGVARTIPGKLVRVNAPKAGELSVWPVEAGDVTGAWNVAAGTLGTINVSKSAAVYERVGDSRLYPVDKAALAGRTLSAEKILYAGTGASGEVDTLILDDATGDCYTYGLASVSTVTFSLPDGGITTDNVIITAANGKSSLALLTNGNVTGYAGKPVGIVASLTMSRDYSLVARAVPLTGIKGVPRAAFRDGYVTVGGVRYPLADNLDDCCYNAIAKAWFESLAAARAYAETLTVYFDRAPEQGGKIRMVVVE